MVFDAGEAVLPDGLLERGDINTRPLLSALKNQDPCWETHLVDNFRAGYIPPAIARACCWALCSFRLALSMLFTERMFMAKAFEYHSSIYP